MYIVNTNEVVYYCKIEFIHSTHDLVITSFASDLEIFCREYSSTNHTDRLAD